MDETLEYMRHAARLQAGPPTETPEGVGRDDGDEGFKTGGGVVTNCGVDIRETWL